MELPKKSPTTTNSDFTFVFTYLCMDILQIVIIYRCDYLLCFFREHSENFFLKIYVTQRNCCSVILLHEWMSE